MENSGTGEWIEVFVTYDLLEAEMLREILQSGGIPVSLRSAKVGPYPVNVGKMGEVKLFVPPGDAEIARELISQEGNSITEGEPEGEGA
ncbi:MAG: DUF2007 domain-containing protein [Nitrospirales bacterium]|nr:DUF2007 domain-containing protein [Nitrospirales bacterium]